jgi:hypothetical protein
MEDSLRKILLLGAVLLLAGPSCSKDSQRGDSGNTNTAGNGASTGITTAFIIPESPVATKSLTVQYVVSADQESANHFFFRWYVDGSIAQEGPSPSLEPGPYKKGSSVYVDIGKSGEETNFFRTKTAVIQNQPPVISSVDINPVPALVKSVITATPKASDADEDETKCTYLWKVNGKPSGSAGDSNQFDTQKLRKKDIVSVVVSCTDGQLSNEPLESGGIMLSNSSPEITSSPSSDLENGIYTYQVTAKDPDGDTVTYGLARGPQGMTISHSGLLQWQAPTQVTEREVPIKIKVDDGDGGTAYQEYSLFLEMK